MLVTGLCLGFGIRIWQSPPQVPSPRLHAANHGVGWLLVQRGADGSWSAEAGGGHARFTPGVTALATLALLHAPEGLSGEVLLPSVRFLENSLSAGMGRESGPQAYNPLLVLKTLLEFESRYPNPERRSRLHAALAHLARLQEADGGWGYGKPSPMGYGESGRGQSNSAVTWWVCDLLRQADRLGMTGLRPSLERGRRWLDARFPDDGLPSYREGGPAYSEDSALFWMARAHGGATHADRSPSTRDYYREIFRNQALAGEAKGPGSWQRNLMALQGTDGAWRGPDRWWLAGGQVYATAAAVLALSPQG